MNQEGSVDEISGLEDDDGESEEDDAEDAVQEEEDDENDASSSNGGNDQIGIEEGEEFIDDFDCDNNSQLIS